MKSWSEFHSENCEIHCSSTVLLYIKIRYTINILRKLKIILLTSLDPDACSVELTEVSRSIVFSCKTQWHLSTVDLGIDVDICRPYPTLTFGRSHVVVSICDFLYHLLKKNVKVCSSVNSFFISFFFTKLCTMEDISVEVTCLRTFTSFHNTFKKEHLKLFIYKIMFLFFLQNCVKCKKHTTLATNRSQLIVLIRIIVTWR